jgi:hypothetical protein
MHHGSKDPKSERYMTDGELVHFGLKLNNGSRKGRLEGNRKANFFSFGWGSSSG